MKFKYEYRTSDNVRHSDIVVASDREAAFRKLRERGIRPGRLVDAPGLMNKLFGRGKRWLAICVLGILLFVAIVVIITSRDAVRQIEDSVGYATVDGFARPIERRQIWGDGYVIDQAARNNWRVIFPCPAERLFALFAEPGVRISTMPRLPDTLESDMDRALAERLRIEPGELEEYQQMKCIVESMKSEFRKYKADGGDLNGYIRRLKIRQEEEAKYLESAQNELQRLYNTGADVDKAWQELNHHMRDQGLPALKMPD